MPAEEREPAPGASRRRLLTAGVVLAATPMTGTASNASSDDAVLIELGRQMDGLYQSIICVWDEGAELQTA